jgi:hypothetical protein
MGRENGFLTAFLKTLFSGQDTKNDGTNTIRLFNMEIFMDQMAVLLDKSQQANFKVWRWKKYGYKSEIERMKDWWRKRIEYLNTEINKF